MAAFDVIVRLVDQTKNSMRNIESGLKNVEQQAAKTNKALGAVGNALIAIGTSAVAGKIVDTARSFGDLEARIRATSGSGAQTAAVMANLVDTANRLGISIQDAGSAFSILRANGIDASYKSLESWTKLAITSGRSVEDIADAVANAYQGSFGKISKATEDLITVEEKFGQYVVKAGGQVIATTTSTAQAVNAIQRYTDANKAFADAFIEKNKGITASINRLQNALAGNAGLKDLDKAVGGLIDNFTKLTVDSGAVTKAIDYLVKGINFLGDNLKLIGSIITGLAIVAFGNKLVALGGVIIKLAKDFNTWIFAASSGGGIIASLLSPFQQLYKIIFGVQGGVNAAAAAFTQASGVITGVLAVIGIFGTSLLKLGGVVLRFVGGPWGILIAGVLTFKDEIIDAGRKVLEFFGILDKKPEFKINIGTPTGAGYRTGPNMPQATPGDGVNVATGTTNPGLDQIKEYLNSFAKAMAQTKREYDALSKVFAKTSDLNVASKMFEDLSKKAEDLGIVLEKPTNLINRDFKIAVNKTTEELRRHTEELKNTALMEQKFINEITDVNNSLEEQSMRLKDVELMTSKFQLELIASNQALQENALKLKDANYQNGLFNQSIESSRQAIQQQQITLDLLNSAFDAGKISLKEYANALGNIDANLLGVNEKTALLKQELSSQEKTWGHNFAVANNIFKLYKDGQLSLKELELAVSQLGEEYFNYEAILKSVLGTSRLEANSVYKKKAAYELLNKEFKDGKVAADVYRKAAENLGVATSDDIERTINVYGTFRDKLVENNEFIKKSIQGAATTFSKQFTEAFMQAKNPLVAFRDFFGNILSDIANRMIKQHLADPLAEALTGIANELIGAKGDGKMGKIMTEGMGATGDTMVETMRTAGTKMMEYMNSAAGGITDIFSGMGDSLGSIFSNVFNWIKDGIGNIGSSLGGLGGLGGGGGSFFGDIFGSIGSFLGFADGGRPPVGQASLVGERGPELFVPDTGGTVVPMDQMGGGSNDALVVNFNLNAIDTMTGTQFLLQNKPAIVNMISEAYNKRGRRGPLD